MSRKSNYPVSELILNRWSPRAMSGESISDRELMTLFEAARWAPSSYNNQPWRFIYAKAGTKHWKIFFDLLAEFNQSWCKNAAVLIAIVSKNDFEKTGEFSRTHSFDTGAAWENLALQASAMGLVVHGMEGFDYNKARVALGVPDDHTVEAMAAIGKKGAMRVLSAELQKREVLSDRRPLESMVFEGKLI